MSPKFNLRHKAVVRLLDSWGPLTASCLTRMLGGTRWSVDAVLDDLQEEGMVEIMGGASVSRHGDEARLAGRYYQLTSRGRQPQFGNPAGKQWARRRFEGTSETTKESVKGRIAIGEQLVPVHLVSVSHVAGLVHEVLYELFPQAPGASYWAKSFKIESEMDLRRGGWYSPCSKALPGIEQVWLTAIPDFRIIAGNKAIFVEVELSEKRKSRYEAYYRLINEQHVLWLCGDAQTADAVRRYHPPQFAHMPITTIALDDIRRALTAWCQSISNNP